MKSLNRNLLTFISGILLLFTIEAAPYNITGMILTDITAVDYVSFKAQAVGWIASKYVTSSVVTSICDDTYLVGGPGVLGPAGASTSGEYFQRSYSGLPTPHNLVYFSFSFWVIDGWVDWTDYIYFSFDSSSSSLFYFLSSYTVSPICGLPGKNEIPNVKFEGVVQHSAPTLTFTIYSRVFRDSLTASFGIRDIKLTFDYIATGTLPAASYCARSPTFYNGGTRCTCANGLYESPPTSGSCAACHTSCATCNGGSSSNCLSCKDGTYFSSNQCLTCDPSCVKCNGAGPSACTSCPEGTFLSGGRCLPCGSSCKTCVDNASKCLSCKPGTYQSGNTCPTCDPSCETCDGGLKTNCLTCPANSYMIPNQKTCITTCASPLTQGTTADSVSTCSTPCASDMTKFVYWDKSCQDTCDSPLVPTTNGPIKLCTYPCAKDEYLYWNGNCQSRCTTPHKIVVNYQKNFCTFPCSSGQALYEDGSCGTCPFPLRTRTGDSGHLYCDYPCASNEFLLWDQTCVSECKDPYQEKIVGTLRYCNFPCESTEYYYWNGTCSLTSCASPFTLRQEGAGDHKRNFCDLACGSGQYLMWYGACGNNCDAPYKNATFKGLAICQAPCPNTSLPIYFEDLDACGKECIAPRILNNSKIYPVCDKAPVPDQGGSLIYFLMNAPLVNEYSLLVPSPNMKFMRYLDVKLPPRLEKLAASQGKFLFSPRFGLSAPTSLRTNAKRLLLAEVFENSGLDTSFLVNFWDGLLTLAIILVITLVLTIFENFLQHAKLKLLHGIVERLMVMGGFNYFLLVYASCIGEIIMYTYIELTNFSEISAGLIIGVILTLLIIPFFGGIVYVVKKATAFGAYNLKNETADKYKKFSIRWRACQVFIRGMNTDSMVKKLFFLIYTARNVLSMLVSVFLISIPIASAIIQIIITLLMIVFMIRKKPLQKYVNHVQLILFESITLVLNLCIFIVVIMGNSDNQDSDMAIVLGDIVIIGTDVLNILVIIFLAIKVRLEVLSILKVLKEYPNHNKAIWINLLSVLAQQTGMGFEEVIEESSIPTSANKYIGLLLKSKSLAGEKAELLKSRSQVYPDDISRKSINDTEPIIKKTEISNIQINGERGSELVTNLDITNNNSLSPPKLQTRVKSVISNISLKKQGTEQNLNLSPTFSIDLSDNSPIIHDNALLLKQASSLESPAAMQTNGQRGSFFPSENTEKNSSRPISALNNDDKRLLSLTPVLPPVIEKAIEETKPTKIADEVGLDDYLKQFGLLSEDSNKASSNVNRKNLSRSPTLKSKKTLR